MGRVISRLLQSDARAFSEWAGALPPTLLKDHANLQLALESAGEGDFKATEDAYRQVASSDTTGALSAKVAQALAKQNGAAAAEWAMRQPEGAARDAAIRKVAEEWSALEPRAAAEWLEQMPAGKERDHCVQEYVRKVVYAEPQVAAEWVEVIAAPKTRQTAAASMYSVWSREDPVAARAWLKELRGVEEKWKKDLLRRAQ